MNERQTLRDWDKFGIRSENFVQTKVKDYQFTRSMRHSEPPFNVVMRNIEVLIKLVKSER